MKHLMCALAALGALSVPGCSTTPSARPTLTLPQRPPPSECLTSCPALPSPPQPADELGALLWVYDVIDTAGQCRRQHDTCRAAK